MSAYFVTATGTDVGKTYVGAALIRYWCAKGIAARALKPLVSGFPGDDVSASDPGVLLRAMGEAVTEENLAALSPWRFAEPLSPDMAAAREDRSIPYDELIAFCTKAIAQAKGPLLVEGVGGVMVPLDARHTVLDWMADLELPLLLVAGSYLGSISHTLTALAALDARGLKPRALVLNDTGNAPVPLEETAAAIARFAPGIAIVTIPRNATNDEISRLAALLA